MLILVGANKIKCLKPIVMQVVFEAYPELTFIVEIDDKFKRVMISERGFNKVFSHEGEVYQRSYDDINAYIQIISPDAIIADAAARNKTFLDIIKKSKTSS